MGSGIASTLGILGESSLLIVTQVAVGTIRTPNAVIVYARGGYTWNPSKEVWESEALKPEDEPGNH